LSQKWTPSAAIRVETVMYKSPIAPKAAYNMTLLASSGTSEYWGTDTLTHPSSYATVFSTNARLTIEKIDGPGGKPIAGAPCGLDSAIYERFGLDGPGGYSAEVNAAGTLIYGYNWQLNRCSATATQKVGWWRLTFSIDPVASYSIATTEGGIPQAFTVNRNVFLDSEDPGDKLGKYFKPVLYPSLFKSVLEIEITQSKGGGGGGGGTGGGGKP
jgi:hypothetical protein